MFCSGGQRSDLSEDNKNTSKIPGVNAKDGSDHLLSRQIADSLGQLTKFQLWVNDDCLGELKLQDGFKPLCKKKININIEDKQKTKCTEKCQRLTIRILKSEKRDKSFEMIKENTVD